jgi:glycerol-3-phosphate dehydrogenase
MNRLARVRRALDREGLQGVAVREDRGAVVLEGELPTWEDRVRAGFAAAGQGFKGVVNDVEAHGVQPERPEPLALEDGALEGARFDVVVVGGGIVGAAIARELTRHALSVALLEKQAC